MDSNKFNLNSFFQYLQNFNFLKNSNIQNSKFIFLSNLKIKLYIYNKVFDKYVNLFFNLKNIWD